MKNVGWLLSLFLAVTAVCTGCCDRGDEPKPPYGRPDDTSWYDGGDYQSVTYTYHCLNGQYVSVSYVSPDPCSEWEKDSEFRSGGICKADGVARLKGPVSLQLAALESAGMEIDTVLRLAPRGTRQGVARP